MKFLSGLEKIIPNDEELMTHIINTKGPISIAINVMNSFMLYKSGIYYPDNCNPYTLNHAVIAVGYGRQNGLDYFIIRNRF